MIQNSPKTIVTIEKLIIGFVLILLVSSLSGCYFSSSLWKKHDEKGESIPIARGQPDKLYLNLREKKICISYLPNNATNKAQIHYLIVSQKAGPTAIGPNYNIQILNEIFSKSSHFHIDSIVANVQKHESEDFFILSLLGTAREGFDFSKFLYNMYKPSDQLLDSPLVLKDFKDEPLAFVYGAFPSNGRLRWVPIQGFTWDGINCDSADWAELPTKEIEFALYYNTSQKIRAFDHSLLTRVVGTPFSVALDIVTSPVQIGVLIYIIFIHGMP